jgi:hypothetical protein
MIKVTINNKAIDIDPRLTIGRYQKVQKNPNFYTNATNILSLYLDIEPKELIGLPVDEIKYVESVLTKHTEKTPTDKIIFTFNTKEYKLPKGITFDFDDGEAAKSNVPRGLNKNKGQAEITFDSYIINKGVSDAMF